MTYKLPNLVFWGDVPITTFTFWHLGVAASHLLCLASSGVCLRWHSSSRPHGKWLTKVKVTDARCCSIRLVVEGRDNANVHENSWQKWMLETYTRQTLTIHFKADN